MRKSILIGLVLTIGYSCSDNVVETDYRNQFLGNYRFEVVEYSCVLYSQDTSYRMYDTIAYEAIGSIEKYGHDRILIKYSQSEPTGRCISFDGNSWCQGSLDSDCVIDCNESHLYFVRNWITPILMENDSMILFQDYSRRNGNGYFYGIDSLNFLISEQEKTYSIAEFIKGVKID